MGAAAEGAIGKAAEVQPLGQWQALVWQHGNSSSPASAVMPSWQCSSDMPLGSGVLAAGSIGAIATDA